MPDEQMSEELKHALGKPSTYHSGPDPSDADAQAAAATKPAPAADANRGNALHDHLKAYFGSKEARVGPEGKSVSQVVDEAVAGAPTTPEE